MAYDVREVVVVPYCEIGYRFCRLTCKAIGMEDMGYREVSDRTDRDKIDKFFGMPHGLWKYYYGNSHAGTTKNSHVQRPKLVVGIVVDQMRWDYLYRFYDRYGNNGGFKRMLNKGFTCENTFIPYAPTVTARGHSSIYTGSVRAINGITGNAWWDRTQMRTVFRPRIKQSTQWEVPPPTENKLPVIY